MLIGSKVRVHGKRKRPAYFVDIIPDHTKNRKNKISVIQLRIRSGKAKLNLILT